MTKHQTNFFQQFRLLLWKNYVLQKRRPIATAFELFIPVLFAILLVAIRAAVTVTRIDDATTWKEYTVNNLPPFSTNILPQDYVWNIGYTPNNTKVNTIMQTVESLLNNNIPKTPLEEKCKFDAKNLVNFIKSQQQGIVQSSPSALLENNSTTSSLLQVTSSDNLTSASSSSVSTSNITLGTTGTSSFNDIFKCILQDQGNKNPGSNSTTAPDDTDATNNDFIFDEMLRILKVIPKVKIISFESESSLLDYAKNDTNLKKLLAGVVLKNLENNAIPNNLEISLRFHSSPITVDTSSSTIFSGLRNSWHTNTLFPVFQAIGPRSNNSQHGGIPYYYKEGYLSLLHAVQRSIAMVETNSSEIGWEFELKRYPYPPYINDDFLIAIRNTLPLLIMLSFMYTSLVIVRSIVQEKELKLKEYMIMMGLSNWLHWLAWFVKYLVFLAISCLLMSLIYKLNVGQGSILSHSDISVIFVFFLFFAAATINFCFLISVFFSKANVGAAAGGIIYALTYMPYLFISDNYNTLSNSLKLTLSLVSNLAMAGGWNLVGRFEAKGTGVQWRTIHEGVTVDSNFTMLHVFGMLFADAIIYMLLAVYIEGIRPGEYGIPKVWYFPFTKSYWFGVTVPPSQYKLLDDNNPDEDRDSVLPNSEQEFYESEPQGLARTVEIKGLRKVYTVNGKKKVAVNELFLNMYHSQITVLLGHNGAGKTTTMSMLTGFFPPTSGDAIIDGHSVTQDIVGVRKAMGLCPQFNILFDLLTVDEHIYFFARLKGMSKVAAISEVASAKAKLNLTEKGSAQSRTLSGGMKRKLSVGIAMCANSKYVILDEPTSGMDPAARRAIWDVLNEYKNHCSILLSTHFMDEADILGDRIAIMAEGKLRCCGSSVFLKNKFGVGYHIVMTKSPACDIDTLSSVISSHVPESRVERISGAEISFLLPFDASPRFSNLFRELDDHSASLGISGYGAVVTTLEEVFLRVTENSNEAVRAVSQKMTQSHLDNLNFDKPTPSGPNRASINTATESIFTNQKLSTGATLWFQQFYALLVKKMLQSMRNYKVALAQLLVPVVFVILAILSVKYTPFEQENVPLDLSLDDYGNNFVYIENQMNLDLGNAFEAQFKNSKVTVVKYKASSNNANTYSARRGDSTQNIIAISDFENYLVEKYIKEGGAFNADNLISASLWKEENTSRFRTWFNDQAFHTPATAIAYAGQAYLRMVTQRNFKFKYINNPLPRNSSSRIQQQLIGSFSGFFVGFYCVLGFAFLASSFCLFLVRERVDRSSLLQTLAGVDPFCFWFSAFAWDLVNILLPCVLSIITFYAFSQSEFTDNVGVVFLLFLLYCWSSLPLMYILSFFFTIPSSALVRVTILNVIIGSGSVITVNVLRIIRSDELANDLNWVFLLLPPYCLGMGLADVYSNDRLVKACTANPIVEEICKSMGLQYQTNFLAWEAYGAGKFVVFLLLQGLVFFVILLCYEFRVHKLFLRLPFPKQAQPNMLQTPVLDEGMDDDVKAEAIKIEDSRLEELTAENQLVIKNLRKVYGRGTNSLVAVQNLNVGIPRNECFGLLGINGAGKTTTFKMLTGDHAPTFGTAYVDGYDMRTHQRRAQQLLGYCPQFDALIDQMTGAETLTMFARLRGVPEKYISNSVSLIAKSLHFDEHLKKPCGTYSGGNKRKLSTAIALIGDPPVVLLDEPSTGMDPGARRMLWDALAAVRGSGKSILITSHSMEECEALCTRLVIMVNGKFECLGGPQHLKNKFGQGYTAEISTGESDVKLVMEKYFPGCEFKDMHNGICTFSIPETLRLASSPLKLATVFENMELAKAEAQFSEYTVTQTTLEQVFLRLVRYQREVSD